MLTGNSLHNWYEAEKNQLSDTTNPSHLENMEWLRLNVELSLVDQVMSDYTPNMKELLGGAEKLERPLKNFPWPECSGVFIDATK